MEARSAGVLRVVVGAGGVAVPGWISTDTGVLDLTRAEDWHRCFGGRPVDALLAEHVWEHLGAIDAERATSLAFKHLVPGGYLRIAVPDGLHPDPQYIDAVRPGGTGAGAEDHKVLHDHRSLTRLLEAQGFRVHLLEWFDEQGAFHFEGWDPEQGLIRRSSRFDPRNQGGLLRYTSLILDAFRPIS